MRFLTVALSLSFFVTGAVGQQPAEAKSKASTKSAKSKKAAVRPTPSKATSAAATSKNARRTTSKSSKKSAPVVVRRPAQQQPTSDRYKEIQQALVDRGYFRGSPDGNWGPDWVEALKRFQRDQNLADDGKIGSLSLIALGLGPKRATLAEPPKTAQP